jgi:hypothetical protein
MAAQKEGREISLFLVDGVQDLVAVPVVEALASLSTQVTVGDLLGEALGNDECGLIGVLLSPADDDAVRGVEADVVQQVQRAHGVAGAELHGQVNVGDGGVSALEQKHCLCIVSYCTKADCITQHRQGEGENARKKKKEKW